MVEIEEATEIARAHPAAAIRLASAAFSHLTRSWSNGCNNRCTSPHLAASLHVKRTMKNKLKDGENVKVTGDGVLFRREKLARAVAKKRGKKIVKGDRCWLVTNDPRPDQSGPDPRATIH